MKKIGQGGMGIVYLSRHLGLHKTVALKILAPALTQTHGQVERFLLEARAAARLDHPNIVGVLNVGFEGDRHFIVMQYVDGESLADRLHREGTLAPLPLLSVARAISLGLAAAHDAGIIHRDIKPGNIMLGLDGSVKVADFGLAKELDADSDLSRTGQVVGSPYYMSPEQAEGRLLDLRTDIYSLGITLYQCLAGCRPFTASTPVGVLLKHIRESPLPLYEIDPDIPLPVCRLVERMMAKDPDRRYLDCRSLALDIERIASTLAHPLGETVVTEAVPEAVPTSRLRAAVLLGFAAAAATVMLLLWGRGFFDGPSPSIATQDPPPATEDPAAPAPERDDSLTDDRALALLSQARSVAVDDRQPPKVRTRARLLEAHAAQLADGMVYVPGGAAVLSGETVTFDAFYIDRFEVTNSQFKLFVLAGGYETEDYWPGPAALLFRRSCAQTPGPRHWKGGRIPPGRAFHPARNITWFEARAYSLWKGRDLPTERQWMLAAGWEPLTGRVRRYPYGATYDEAAAYTGIGTGHPPTVAVSGFARGRSALGLHHAAGNVYEWTSDWFAASREFKVRKGGDSADVMPQEMTLVAWRDRAPPDLPAPFTGFRTVCKAPSRKALGLGR